MKAIHEIVPKGTLPCDAPPNMVCRPVMKSFSETVPVTFTVPTQKCDGKKCKTVMDIRVKEEVRLVMKMVNEIVPTQSKRRLRP